MFARNKITAPNLQSLRLFDNCLKANHQKLVDIYVIFEGSCIEGLSENCILNAFLLK